LKSLFTALAARSATRTVAGRLALAWLPLSFVIGVAVWHYETERVEARVLNDAVADSRRVKDAELDRYYRHQLTLVDLHGAARKVLGDFVSVEIYDGNKAELVHELNERAVLVPTELWRRAETVPLSDRPSYEQVSLNDRMTIITVVPLENESKDIIGYLKGIYIISDDMLAEMREDSIGAVVVALGSMLVTMLVAFPIIVLLQRRDAAQTRLLLQGNLELLEVLGNVVAHRDSDTDSHNYRVTLYALRLAEHMGLTEDSIRILVVGAFLHDVGKVGVSDTILLKPGKLTEEEFRIMKSHVAIGEQIVQRSGWLAQAACVVKCHHEKFDGTGYPCGLEGKDIPVEARLFAVADVFDALTSRRPYKEPLVFDAALEIMRRNSGSHFDPDMFAHFQAVASRIYHDIGQASYEELRSTLLASVQRYFIAP